MLTDSKDYAIRGCENPYIIQYRISNSIYHVNDARNHKILINRAVIRLE